MKEKEFEGCKKSQGFSLVEILVAVGILGVVSMIVMGLMQQGSKTYERTNSETDIQQEVQIIANNLTERIVDCNSSVMFFNAPTDTILGLPATGVTSVLHIMNEKEHAVVVFDEDKNRLFFNSSNATGSTGEGDPVYEPLLESNQEVLANNVYDFSVDTSRVEEGRIIEFTIGYKVRGREYQGNYQVRLRNGVTVSDNSAKKEEDKPTITSIAVSPKYAYMSVKGSGTSFDKNIFTATVKGLGIVQQDVDWELAVDPTRLTNIQLNPIGPQMAEIVQGPQKDSSNAPLQMDASVKSFKVVATSKVNTAKTGYATVLVKKVISVKVAPVNELTLKNKRGLIAVPNNTRVDFQAILDYWNLTAAEKGVTWKLEYRHLGNTISAWSSNTPNTLAELKGSSLIVKGATEGHEFRITAVSVFDDTVYGSFHLGVVEDKAEYGDGLVRGANMNFKKYFEVNRTNLMTSKGLSYIKSVRLTHVTDYPDFAEFITCTEDGVVYIDYDAYHDGVDPSRRNNIFYKNGFVLTFKVDFIDINGDEQCDTAVNVNFPGVKVTKGTPASTDILMSKGSTQTIIMNTGYYNVSAASQVAAYIDGIKVTQTGNENLNNYLGCALISAESGKSILGTRTNAVESAKFKLSAKSTGDKMCPTGPIPLILCLDDWYNISSKADGYIAYNVYISNVEGATQYIPGPDATGTYLFPGTCNNKKITTVNGTQVTVTITRSSTNIYTLKYGGNTYNYDSVYKYWKLA